MGGIILTTPTPSGVRIEATREAIVLEIGEEQERVKVGDKVLLLSYAGVQIFAHKDLRILEEKEVLGILTPAN